MVIQLPRNSSKLELTVSLLQQSGAYAPPYDEQVGELLALLNGTYTSGQGLVASAPARRRGGGAGRWPSRPSSIPAS
ncbi:MAG: hypothetical protein ACRDOI_35655 [Trebonia sp.]